MKNIILISILGFSSSAFAEIFGGIDFPDGSISFADSVITYDPNFGVGPAPTDPNFIDPSAALGPPDYSSFVGSVSLGRGGLLILQFVDNKLTGSNDDQADLHIFEIGPDVEDTFVAISKNGSDWTEVGKVFGSTSSIDIDQFGFDSTDSFSYVRLIDDPNEGAASGTTVGADIDAVGAISTVATPVPLPAPFLLLLVGLGFIHTNTRR